jgi:hypothetical protein
MMRIIISNLIVFEILASENEDLCSCVYRVPMRFTGSKPESCSTFSVLSATKRVVKQTLKPRYRVGLQKAPCHGLQIMLEVFFYY